MIEILNQIPYQDGYLPSSPTTHHQRTFIPRPSTRVYIVTMIRLISDGQYPQLTPFLKETDYTTAAALVTCMDKKKRDEFAQKTADVIADGTHAGNNINSFQRFLERFRAGPSPSAPHETETEMEVDDGVTRQDDNAGNTTKGKLLYKCPTSEMLHTSCTVRSYGCLRHTCGPNN